jgi:hypothetical protein
MRWRFFVFLWSALAAHAAGEDLRLNHLQAIGSHNSYHVAPPAGLLDTLKKFNKDAAAWNYTHPPLADQLDLGIRQFELDVFADTEGGLYSSPMGIKLGALSGNKLPPFDPGGELKKPGFKVLHVPDLDCWSHVPTLKAALSQLLAWSDQHPRHLPLMILIECKDRPHPPLPTKPQPFTRERLMELEQEILSVLPVGRILRPDDVRGKADTLREAVLSRGWPGLDSLRGKFLFCLDNTDDIRSRYLEGNPGLQQRLLFASAPDARHPAAGWFKLNDPVRDHARILELVKAGFLVRTRADTRQADPVMKEKAFTSGAQWISTDHFAGPEPVSFGPGQTMRINPVSLGAVPAGGGPME